MTRALHKKFFEHVDIGSYRSILALHGKLPDRSFFEMSGLPIIAADGASNVLDHMSILLQVIVGDLDSAKPELLARTEAVYAPNQDKCDFEKSLDYASLDGFLPSIIVGVNGGYIDHILNNINIIMGCGSIFYDPPIVGHVINNKQPTTFTLPINTKISIIGVPSALVSSKGLKWELEDMKLEFPGLTSAFNRSAAEQVSIKVHAGACLILIYLEKIEDCGSVAQLF